MTITIELSPEEQAQAERQAAARGLALPEFVKLRALEGVPTEAKDPASGEELEALFEQWKAEAKDPTPEEDAAWDQLERNLQEGGVTMRRVDVSDGE